MYRRYLLGVILFSVISGSWAEPRVFKLSAEEWARPRSGQAIIAFPQLRDLVVVWSAQKNTDIEVRYPGGDEGSLWGRELQDWLVALGIPAEYIHVVPGSARADQITLHIMPR